MLTSRIRSRSVWCAVACLVPLLKVGAQASPAAIAAGREQHERQIVDELLQVVALPNVARNDADMRANATLLTTLFQRRGFTVEASQDVSAPVQLPTLGGTLPFAEFSETLRLPTVGVSLVTHDNNQHGPDENIRLRNLFEGVEILAAIMTMPTSPPPPVP